MAIQRAEKSTPLVRRYNGLNFRPFRSRWCRRNERGLAGDIAGFGVQKEGGRPGDIVRRAHPPHGNAIDHPLTLVHLLRLAGIPTTSDEAAANADAAVDAASRAGYPVVLKALCRELVHKSDIGGVALNLAHARAVREAWTEIERNVERHLPHSRLDGCVVQPMVIGGAEVVIGAKWDSQFGAVVMAGAGGVFVELLHDIALALAPLTYDRARSLLASLQIWPLMLGARGRPRGDVEALADALMRLSWLAYTLGPQLVELDVNPLLVQTQGVIALDARATLAKGGVHG